MDNQLKFIHKKGFTVKIYPVVQTSKNQPLSKIVIARVNGSDVREYFDSSIIECLNQIVSCIKGEPPKVRREFGYSPMRPNIKKTGFIGHERRSKAPNGN